MRNKDNIAIAGYRWEGRVRDLMVGGGFLGGGNRKGGFLRGRDIGKEMDG